jgi:hypothetical protein
MDFPQANKGRGREWEKCAKVKHRISTDAALRDIVNMETSKKRLQLARHTGSKLLLQ